MKEKEVKGKLISDADKVLARALFPNLHENEAIILLCLFRDSSVTDSKLTDMMGFSSVTSAAHYRKLLEKKRIIKRYALDLDWEKLGYKTKFLILTEAENTETLHQIAKDHVLSIEDYTKKMGEILITPTPFGSIVLLEVSTAFGEMGIVSGLATSEDAVKSYSDIYLKERYPRMRQKLLLVRDVTIEDGIINIEFIGKYKSMLNITQKDKERLEEFRKMFPWKRFKP